MKRLSTGVLILFAALPSWSAKFHDSPDEGLGGGITAIVSPIEQLEEVVVIEPTELRAYVAQIDRGAGRFRLQGIAPGKYDLLLRFRRVIVEGVRLDVPGGSEKLSAADRRGIEHITWISDDYFNDKTIVRMRGNDKRATLLVQQLRDLKTYRPDGSVMQGMLIRRIELTEMQKTGKIWSIRRTRHLFREERPKRERGSKPDFLYARGLGGIRVGDQVVELPVIRLAGLSNTKTPHSYSAHHRAK